MKCLTRVYGEYTVATPEAKAERRRTQARRLCLTHVWIARACMCMALHQPGCAIRATSTSLKTPARSMSIFPDPSSSAGVPNTVTCDQHPPTMLLSCYKL